MVYLAYDNLGYLEGEKRVYFLNNRSMMVDEMVDEIKVLSWNWSLSRLRIASCLFYEWTWNQKDCINR